MLVNPSGSKHSRLVGNIPPNLKCQKLVLAGLYPSLHTKAMVRSWKDFVPPPKILGFFWQMLGALLALASLRKIFFR